MIAQDTVIQYILERWAVSLALPMEPHTIRSAVNNAMLSDREEHLGGWREVLFLSASQIGLKPILLHIPPSSLSQQERMFPLLVYLSEAKEDTQWIVILQRYRNRYLISTCQEKEDFWITEQDLFSRYLCLVHPDQTIEFCSFEPTQPLDSWKTDESQESLPDTTKVWSRLKGLVFSERKDISVIVIYAVVIGLFSLATPVAVQALVNTVAFGTLLQPLVVLSLMLAAGLIFLACMQFMQTYLTEMISRRVFVRVVDDFAHRLPRIHAKVFEKYNRAEIANYFFDVLTIQKVSSSLLFDGFTSVLTIGSGLLLLAIYHPILLAFDVFLILAILSLVFLFGRGAIKSSIKESKTKHKVAAWLDGLLQNPLMFRSHGGMQYAQLQAELLTRDYLKARSSHFWVVVRQLLAGLAIQVLVSTALLLIGGWLVIAQQLTLGQLVAAELIVSVVVASLFKLIKSFEKFYDLMAALDKIGKVIDLDTERQDGVFLAPDNQPALLQFSHVSQVSSLEQKLFHDFTLDVPRGAKLAVMGDNLAGKHALADILFGTQKPKEGLVLVNGRAIRDMNLLDFRRMVALVRDVEFVEASILENLSLQRQEVGRVESRNALTKVGLIQDIQTLPHGIQTVLRPDGSPLSPYQLRLLMLARAIAARPHLLVIDGLLDAFDTETIASLQQSLLSTHTPWTTVIFTERQDVAAGCDLVYHMDSFIKKT